MLVGVLLLEFRISMLLGVSGCKISKNDYVMVFAVGVYDNEAYKAQ